MLRWLSVLLILVSSSVCLGAEEIVYNGEKGVFFEEQEAKEALKQLEELPSLRRQKALLEKEVEKYKELDKLTEEKAQVATDIGESWKKNYEALAASIKETEDDDLDTYIGMGIFAAGVVVGASFVFLSSLVLKNIEGSEQAR